MATVLLAPPLDDGEGTYATNADGSPVPFPVTGWVDVPGQLVTLYEDTTGALLGTGTASSSPDVGGAHPGWYGWSATVAAWTTSGGALIPAATATTSAGIPGRAGALALAASLATSSAGAIDFTVMELNSLPSATATTSAGGLLPAAARGLTASSATSSAGSISIASDTTVPVVSAFSVTPGTGTACTFSATLTDNVAPTKWLLIEGATDPGTTDPGQTGATTYTTNPSSLAFTSSATSTGTRHWRLHAWDAAGNHGVSADYSATVTIAAGAGIAYGAAGAAAYAFVGDGAALTVSLPSGITAGDILLMLVGQGTNGQGADLPSGWTDAALSGWGTAFAGGILAWRRATGSDGSTVGVTVHGDDGEGPIATNCVGRIWRFSGCVASGSPLDVAAIVNSSSGSSLTGSTRTTATANAMMIAVGGNVGQNVTYSAPGGSVDTIVEAHGAGYGIALLYDDAPSGSPGSKSAPTCTGSLSTTWFLATCALKPA